jgi:hypothetical protein
LGAFEVGQRTGGVAQAVDYLLCKHKSLVQTPVTPKKEKDLRRVSKKVGVYFTLLSGSRDNFIIGYIMGSAVTFILD